MINKILQDAFYMCSFKEEERAIEILNKALEQNEEILFLKAMILEKCNNIIEAEELYRKAFKLNPKYINNLYYARKLGLDEFIEAVNVGVEYGIIDFANYLKDFTGLQS